MPKDESTAPIDPGGSQPTIEVDLGKAVALLALDNRLKAELATFAKGSPGTELIRGIRQLGAMIQYVQSDPEIIALNIHLPAFRLHAALVDLCAGGKPSLLFKASRPPGFKTKQKVSSAHFPQGILAIGYAALVERGGYKPVRAIEWLTGALKTHNMPACGEDIRGWYNQCNAPKGRPAAASWESSNRHPTRQVRSPHLSGR
jgi:energy-converting hydrogenase Eha subunit A